ncbi:MAG: methyltransferase [Candidatus Burarchaeum sp.]|nr:methyltransferase [Candidatus Burarchaeum sp.]MDO8339601.1 methyltransferase [Candidatus Burarchaeum sp.]
MFENVTGKQGASARAALAALLEGDRKAYLDIFRAEAAAKLPPEVAEPLLAVGMITKTRPESHYETECRLWENDGVFIATDRFTANRPDRVYPIFLDESDFLARRLEVKEGDDVLDIGTGSGIQAIVCASKGAEATAVDINSRALDFAKFNAALNGVQGRIRFVKSDMFANLGNEKYDLIVTNPPFIAVPSPSSWFLHGAAGSDGLGALRKFLPGAQSRLKPDGRLQIISNSFVREEGRIHVVELLQSAFGHTKLGIHVEHAFSPSIIPTNEYMRRFWGAPGHEEWVREIEKDDFTGVCRAVFTIRMAQEAQTSFEELREPYLCDELLLFGQRPVWLAEPHASGGWPEMLARYGALDKEKSHRISETFKLPVETKCGTLEFECTAFQKDDETYIVLQKRWEGDAPLVRMQSACTFGHIFRSEKCNCSPQLEDALVRIGTEGGVLIYALHQDGRGVSVVDHANAYALQERGMDTVDSYEALGLQIDSREYKNAAKILRYCCNIREARLITNNPDKAYALEKIGVRVVEMVPALVSPERLTSWRARQFLAGPKMGHVFPTDFLTTVRQRLIKV